MNKLVWIRRFVYRGGLAFARILLMLTVGLALYVRLFERKLIFYPTQKLDCFPEVPFDNVYFNAKDGTRLHGWFIPSEGSPDVLVVSHGNAGNIGDRCAMGQYVQEQFRWNVLMYDYRGYGRSEGKPSEAGLYSDLRGAIDYVQSRGFGLPNTYLLGQSLGTGVTVEVASTQPVAGIILEAPFTSVPGIARKLTLLPIGFLFTMRFDSLAKIEKVDARVVVVHATSDPVIPYDLGMQLFNAIRAPKKLFTIDRRVHEGALMELPSDAMSELRHFLHGDER